MSGRSKAGPVRSRLRLRYLAPLACVAVAVVVAALTGTANVSRAALPSCAGGDGQAARPTALRGFPLPHGSSLDRSHREHGYVVVTGYVPGEVVHVRDFFLSRLPRAGFALGSGDAEAAEAETAFSGHSVLGRLKVHTMVGCPGALTLQIAVRARP